ncbi:MAG: sigma-70 family RNA polymerase sigma factor [Agriterribacter sp.]
MLTACTYNEKELLLRISAGDASAFALLFNQYKDKIYTIGFKITGSAFLAEEVVQEIFMKLWTNRKTLPELECFTAWFNTVTRNHLFSLIKRKAAREQREIVFANKIPAFYNNADENILLKDAGELLEKALYTLPPQQNKVYRLIKERGMKKEEVASQLNLSTETVKAHLSKAMKSIRAYYLAHMDHPAILILVFFFLE